MLKGMEIDDERLLRELRRALDAVSGQGRDAQFVAMRQVMDRHGLSLGDISAAVQRMRDRQTSELGGLAGRIGRLAEVREEQQSTADAVDTFLRSLGREQ